MARPDLPDEMVELLEDVLLDTIEALVVVLDTEGRIVLFNRSCERATGYGFDEVRGRPFWDFLLAAEEVDAVRGVFADLGAGRYPNQHENDWIGKDGRRRRIAWSNTAFRGADGKVKYVVGTGIDVTEKGDLKKEIRWNQERFQAFMDRSPALAWMKDPSGRYAYVNSTYGRTFNRSVGEVVGRTDADLFPAAVAEELGKHDRAVLASDTPAELVERVPTPDGVEHVWVVIKFPFTDPSGERFVGGVAVDITDRETVREELRASEARARTVLDTAVDAIITIDERGTIETVNPAVERLFGYPPDELVGRNVRILMPPPFHEEHDGYLANYARTRERKIIGIGREVQGRRRDGTLFPLYISVGETAGPGRRTYVGILHDLSDLKRKEEELVQSRSLAAIGESASAIAHEIKNPLAAISAPIQVIRDGLAAEDPRHEILQDVLAQVKRLDGTVRQLLLLSRPWKPKKEQCELAPVIRRVIGLAREQEAFRKVRVDLQGAPGAAAPADPALLEQVLWNLVLNAAQAMPDGGTLRIVVAASSTDARIRVTDDGPGIPDEMRTRLFQPFATTKPGGTGLGLSICRKIMEAHGGRLELEPGGGAGTTFTLSLPLSG